MLRSAASKVMWVGRATVFMVGLAVILALLFGLASAALGANGKPLILGKAANTATRVTGLVGNVADTTRAALSVTNTRGGSALELKVTDPDTTDPAQKDVAPMKVDSQQVVTHLNADELDGKDESAFASAYKRTVVVSPVGTDTENGTALLNALSGITDASATKPYLLKIEPGVYDLGSSGSLAMKEHVDIEGSGELTTVITSSVTQGPEDDSCPIGTVAGADNAELRFLTVRNTGTGSCNVAIRNESVSPRLTHVTAESTGVEGENPAYMGVLNSNACPTISDATVTAPTGGGIGVYSEGSTTGCSVFIKQSKISGGESAVNHVSGISYVAHSQIVGFTTNVRCFNSYDENLQSHSCG
jgi:hypothetical protein